VNVKGALERLEKQGKIEVLSESRPFRYRVLHEV